MEMEVVNVVNCECCEKMQSSMLRTDLIKTMTFTCNEI